MVNTKVRVSPSESATEFESGTIRIGNDGNEYIISVDKNGKHRWAKYNGNKEVKQTKPKAPKAPKAPKVVKTTETIEVIQVEETFVPVPESKPEEEPKPIKVKKVSKKRVLEIKTEDKSEIKTEEVPIVEKKVAVRKAPLEHAKDYDEGYEMMGQDGKIHVIKMNKNGVKRWAHAN